MWTKHLGFSRCYWVEWKQKTSSFLCGIDDNLIQAFKKLTCFIHLLRFLFSAFIFIIFVKFEIQCIKLLVTWEFHNIDIWRKRRTIERNIKNRKTTILDYFQRNVQIHRILFNIISSSSRLSLRHLSIVNFFSWIYFFFEEILFYQWNELKIRLMVSIKQ